MRPDENCDQCRFHLAGMCRRMPPAAHDGGRIGGLPIAVWPLVRPEDWCGEFRRRTPDPPAQIARATSPGRLGTELAHRLWYVAWRKHLRDR